MADPHATVDDAIDDTLAAINQGQVQGVNYAPPLDPPRLEYLQSYYDKDYFYSADLPQPEAHDWRPTNPLREQAAHRVGLFAGKTRKLHDAATNFSYNDVLTFEISGFRVRKMCEGLLVKPSVATLSKFYQLAVKIGATTNATQLDRTHIKTFREWVKAKGAGFRGKVDCMAAENRIRIMGTLMLIKPHIRASVGLDSAPVTHAQPVEPNAAPLKLNGAVDDMDEEDDIS